MGQAAVGPTGLADSAEAVLLHLAERLGAEMEPIGILTIAAEEVGRRLGANRCGYGEVDRDRDEIVISIDWTDGVPSMVGRHPLHRSSVFVRDYEIGRNGVVEDARALTLPLPVRDALAASQCRSFVAAPLIDDGVLVGLFAVQCRDARRWTAAEIDLVERTAAMTWSALRHARATRERDRSQAFLIEWNDALGRVETPDDIMKTTLESLGRHLGATRVTYAEIDGTGRVFTTRWNWSDGCGSLVGLKVHLDQVDPQVEQEWLTGKVVRYDDVTCDPEIGEAARATYAARRIVAFVSIPLVRGSAVQAILSVQSDRPRAWRDAEIGLIRDVGERTWPILERARAQAELRDRDRDQRFVIAWSDSVRAEGSPAAIIDTTMAMLGQHLGATRAAYSRIELNGGVYRIVGEWCRGVAPTLGLTYPSSNLSDHVRAAYLAGETLVSPDLPSDERFSLAARQSFAANRVVARIGVPLSRDGVVQAVLSIDADRPREWTPVEVQLARDIAERLWVLLHRAEAEASLKERERNQSFLIAWSDRIRDEPHPRAILAATLAMIGGHVQVNRANYAEAADAGEALKVLQEWRDGTVSVVGQNFPLTALGEHIVAAHLTDPAIVVRSVAEDPRFDAVNRPLYERVGVAAFVSVPLVRNGAIEGVLSIQADAARDWTREEVQLLRDLADRTWAVLERARSEERMADTEALLDAFMENAPLGMHLKDANGRYLRMNPELARQIAIPVERVVGHLPNDFLPPDVANRVIDLEQRALAGHIASAEFVFPDRTDYAALLAVVFPIDGSRGVARTGGFTLDLTARKTTEAALQQSRDALHQSEKLTALGSLLAGVSHELNNPLSIVVAQASMMERQARDGPLAERAFKIRRAADRCARIVETFLSLARQKPPERAAVNLNAVVDAALDLASYNLRVEGIAVAFQRAADLPTIAADADQVHQIIINLIINAQHALAAHEGARMLTLSTAIGPEPETVILDIADSGPGIPDDIARRIFEPFFTTKEQGEGTGLGLSFSQGLAEAHGGRLVLRPHVGGACFRLTLPVDADRILPRVILAEAAPAARPDQRALVVDDEEEIAESLADILTLQGVACEIATSGATACTMLVGGNYDFVLSDLRMPHMDGPALYAWVLRERPDLAGRMGFVTGDTLGAKGARFLADVARPVLEKPFTAEKVRLFLAEIGTSGIMS